LNGTLIFHFLLSTFLFHVHPLIVYFPIRFLIVFILRLIVELDVDLLRVVTSTLRPA
jgi:hypothetical protein